MYDNHAFLLTAKRYAKLFNVNLRVQGPSAYSRYSNGNGLITIPRLQLDSEYNKRLCYGYIAHEAGHLKFTDFNVVTNISRAEDTLLFNLFNILEDYRIEQLMSRLFIGVKENIDLLNHHFDDDLKFATEHIDSVQKADKITIYVQSYIQAYGLNHTNKIPFVETVRSFLCKTLSPDIVDKIDTELQHFISQSMSDVSTMNVAARAKLIRTLCGKVNQDTQNKKDTQNRKDTQDKDSFSGGSNESGKTDKVDSNLRSQLTKSVGNLVNTYDDTRFFSECLDKTSTSRDDLGDLSVEKCNPGITNWETKMDMRDLGFVRSLHNYVRTETQKLLEAAEQGHKLNVNKLIRVPCGEEHIFKSRQLELDHDTFVHMLVDVSGSMMSLLKDFGRVSRADCANSVALKIAKALSNIPNVDRAVSYFPGLTCEVATALERGEILGTKQKFMFDQSPRGSTPFAQATWHALHTMKFSERERNIILIVTDGMPDSVKQARVAVNMARKYGVEVYVVFIAGAGLTEDVLHKFYEVAADAPKGSDKIIVDGFSVVTSAEAMQNSMSNVIRQVFNSKSYKSVA